MCADHGLTFSKPVIFDSNQKLAMHAHILLVTAGGTLVVWDDVNGPSSVKWGFLDSTMQSKPPMGTPTNALYAVVAISGSRVEIVALLPDGEGVVLTIQLISR